MTTLRDIINDSDALWRDNAGDVWDQTELLMQWTDELDREAICIGGQIRYLDEHGYVTGAEAVLTEVPA